MLSHRSRTTDGRLSSGNRRADGTASSAAVRAVSLRLDSLL